MKKCIGARLTDIDISQVYQDQCICGPICANTKPLFLLPKAQDDVLQCFVLSTTERYLVCHRVVK